jgi:isoquinoline 1-oxidoreductase subunit beta
MKVPKQVSRRKFIRAAAIGAGGLTIAFSIPLAKRFINTQSAPALVPFNAYLTIGEDGYIYVKLAKIEMGQDIFTTLALIIAEELDCDMQLVKVQHLQTDMLENVKGDAFLHYTGGSDTTRTHFEVYRKAGATARQMLINAAIKKYSVIPASCTTSGGYVMSGTSRWPYAELAATAATLPVPEVKCKASDDWKLIGKSHGRLDITEKITGSAKYGIDQYFDGMLTAVVAHPPVFGARVKSFDATDAKRFKGVITIVAIDTGVAVLAENFYAASAARDVLKIEWDFNEVERVDTKKQAEAYMQLAKTRGKTTQEKGDVDQAIQKATKVLEAQIIFPYLAHAAMEPLNCTVRIDDDVCEIWCGTQCPVPYQQEVATFLNLPVEKVILHAPVIGGSFGRRGAFGGDWMIEAVKIAKATGRFIKLVWTREDDIRGGYYRPVYLHHVKIALDKNGQAAAWLHKIIGPSLFGNTPLRNEIAPGEIDYSSVGGVHASPYLGNINNHRVELITTKENVPVSSWRSVGHTHTAFAMETMIDELAEVAGFDPVTYRRVHLKNHPRHLAALNLAAEKSGWGTQLPEGTYRGVAVHAAMASYVCHVAEIEVKDDRIKVKRVVCAIDCGLAVNPEGVRAQMEGGIVFGLSAALYGEITLTEGLVDQSNFHDYPVLHMNEMPVIEVYIVESNAPMGGVGEPGVPPIAPAIANAVYAATGKRIRRLPIRLE